MPPSDPKSKNTGSKIRFFKLEENGDISPVFPEKRQDTATHAATNHSQIKIEPFLTSENPLAPPAPDALSEVIEAQLGELRPQVESIAKLSANDDQLSVDQVDLLKKYIALKESEVRDVRDQNKQYHAFAQKISKQLEASLERAREALLELESSQRSEEALRHELSELRTKYQDDFARLKNDFDEKLQRFPGVQTDEAEWERRRKEWQEKIKEDLKRIKLKEKELENKYELFRRDTQALLDSKDKHLLELKNRCDALELELETMDERVRNSNAVVAEVGQKKTRLIETLKLAISLLEEIDSLNESSHSSDRKAG